MRVALLSDLHVDLIPGRHRRSVVTAIGDCMRAREVDVVVVAGDVANKMTPILDNLPHLAVGRAANIFVPGNHDVWRTDRERAQGRTSFGQLTLLASRIPATGFHYLPGAPITISDGTDIVAFAGTIGWYDYGFAYPDLGISPEVYAAKRWRGSTWQDRDHATWIGYGGHYWPDGEVSTYFLAGLERDLRTLGVDEDGNGPTTIAVSHMLPYADLIYRDPDPEQAFYAAYLGSPKHGALLDRFPAIRGVFAGHTHRPQRHLRPSGTIAAVAPFGVFGEIDFPDHAVDRIGWFDVHGREVIERDGMELFREVRASQPHSASCSAA